MAITSSICCGRRVRFADYVSFDFHPGENVDVAGDVTAFRAASLEAFDWYQVGTGDVVDGTGYPLPKKG